MSAAPFPNDPADHHAGEAAEDHDKFSRPVVPAGDEIQPVSVAQQQQYAAGDEIATAPGDGLLKRLSKIPPGAPRKDIDDRANEHQRALLLIDRFGTSSEAYPILVAGARARPSGSCRLYLSFAGFSD